ncbi:hypothetical protein CNEO4_780039 [Clostridium neonatale]|nr:hypothetical protein [Clostridium neonatale]CAI3691409.1 hypothetical protein CNEO4_780039 [Clostridium neonatale]
MQLTLSQKQLAVKKVEEIYHRNILLLKIINVYEINAMRGFEKWIIL